MRILAICPHFQPDVAPTGEVMTRIVTELAALGHEVEVVTALPWYRHHDIEKGWEGRLVRTEAMPWGRIVRLHPFPTDKANLVSRGLAFGAFSGFATSMALAVPTRPDVVLAMSPPLTLGIAGWLAATRWGVPFVFNVQDIFPDVAEELGRITNRRVLSAAGRLERFIYHRADAVTVLSEDLAENVLAKIGGGGTEVRVIPNFVDHDWIVPGDRCNSYRQQYGLGDRTVVMYAGNVGYSQSLDLLLGAAGAFAERSDVVFVINGAGVARDVLMAEASDLPNVVFVDLQPKARLPEVLAAADIQLVPLRSGLARSSVPSKLYYILAAGRPVIASVDGGSEVERVLERSGAGLAVAPDDQAALTAAITKLVDDPDGRLAAGRRGRDFIESWYSPSAVAVAYDTLFAELGAPRSATSGGSVLAHG